MCVLLWTISFLALLLTFVQDSPIGDGALLGLGTALGLIGIWGLGAVIFCVVVLYCTSTLIDKNYKTAP